MTNASSSPQPIVLAYVTAFETRCYELLEIGYGRMQHSTLAILHEEVITQKLRNQMEAALDARNGPVWATHFTVVDEQYESVNGKTGKSRPRIDLAIRCINPRPSVQFRFEAKRLDNPSALTKYLGKDGMLELLTGHYGDLERSGMIGYVQKGTCADWAKKIKKEIKDNPTNYHAKQPVNFTDLSIAICGKIFESAHNCGIPAKDRHITHTLLLCA